MISQYIEASILAFIQGFSEFIPISSSAHLILISKFYDFNIGSLQLDISLHLGSLLAIIFYFRNDLFNITKNKHLFSLIILGSLPLIFIGYIFFTTGLIDYFRNLKIIAWTTLIFGLLLFFADRSQIKQKLDVNLNYKSIIIIGLFQVLAIIPGVSRSGIVITASRLLSFDRVDSSKIAFYLSIPALAGASVLGIRNILENNINFNLIFLFSIIFSFFISLLTIKYFLIYVKNFDLKFFVYYRIFLAFILFIIIYV
tara:strand:- start:1181 stop:1948 length:768 start_codon:yes stop_codon:yes gene_type:complete